MTREEIQQRIDHYAAVAEAYRRATHNMLDFHVGFYMGKQDVWIDIWKEQYPDEDRAYPRNEEEFEKDVQFQLNIISKTK